MHNGIFITGTDTEAGKTVVTAGILRYLRRHKVDAVSMKPVQTGASLDGETLSAPDLQFHLDTAELKPSKLELELMAPYIYEPACSPHLAGRMAGKYPDVNRVHHCAHGLLEIHSYLLVEGAGGVMAPIDESSTMLDLMCSLELPVILVARRGLGTINHSLLSLRVLRQAGLEVLGIVFNETENVSEDYIRKDNPHTVATMGEVELLGDVDYLQDLSPESATAWEQFEECMPGLPKLLERAP